MSTSAQNSRGSLQVRPVRYGIYAGSVLYDEGGMEGKVLTVVIVVNGYRGGWGGLSGRYDWDLR